MRSPGRFNRTFLVLKLRTPDRTTVLTPRFNRTFLVLKYRHLKRHLTAEQGFNRTFLVLKSAIAAQKIKERKSVLIAPFWY